MTLRNPRDPRILARNTRLSAPILSPERRKTGSPDDSTLGAWDNEGGAAAPRRTDAA